MHVDNVYIWGTINCMHTMYMQRSNQSTCTVCLHGVEQVCTMYIMYTHWRKATAQKVQEIGGTEYHHLCNLCILLHLKKWQSSGHKIRDTHVAVGLLCTWESNLHTACPMSMLQYNSVQGHIHSICIRPTGTCLHCFNPLRFISVCRTPSHVTGCTCSTLSVGLLWSSESPA